jgi:adenylate cyclase
MTTSKSWDARLRRFSIPGWPVSPSKAAGRFRSVTVPLEVFLKTAKGVGNVRVIPDSDGIYRRMPLTFAFRDLVLPSVPLALSEFIGSRPDFSSVPLDETGQIVIRFWGPAGTYRTYPIATLINSWAQMQEGQKPQIPPRNSPGRLSWSASAPSASTTSNPVP